MHHLSYCARAEHATGKVSDFSSRKAPRLPVSQLPWTPWTTTFCSATSPHCNGRQTGTTLDLSWQHLSPTGATALPLDILLCHFFFLCAYSLELWLVWDASGLPDIQNWATWEWVIGGDRKKEKEKTGEGRSFPVTAYDSNNLVPTLLY